MKIVPFYSRPLPQLKYLIRLNNDRISYEILNKICNRNFDTFELFQSNSGRFAWVCTYLLQWNPYCIFDSISFNSLLLKCELNRLLVLLAAAAIGMFEGRGGTHPNKSKKLFPLVSKLFSTSVSSSLSFHNEG